MIEKKLNLYIRPDSESDDGFSYFVIDPAFGYQWTKDHDIKIGEVNVSFVVPDELSEDDLRRKAIDTLKEKQDEIRATAFRDIERLQTRIDQMLLLTHDTGEAIVNE